MSLEDVEDYVRRGARGIKMHTGIQDFGPEDPGLLKFYDFCGLHHLPITFHCGETSRVHLNGYTDMDSDD